MWAATIVMATVAYAFVGLPLLKNNRRSSVLVSVVILPVFAAGLYWSLGTPAAAYGVASPAGESKMSHSKSSTSSGRPVGSVASMVSGLAARLAENPNDGGSWLLLAKSYKHLGQIPDAIAAYSKAAALGNTDADLATSSGIQAPIIQ
jgi:cytochrome c-type biogenesis protein CcmH